MNSSITTSAPAAPKAPPKISSIAGQRLGHGHRHDHALARGQPVGLDHDRRALARERSPLPCRVGKSRPGGGGRAAGVADLLGEGLRGLQPRRLLAGAEAQDAGLAQPVGDACGKRRLGTDDDEVDAVVDGESPRPARRPRMSSDGAFGDPPRSRHCRAPRSAGRTWGSASPPRPAHVRARRRRGSGCSCRTAPLSPCLRPRSKLGADRARQGSPCPT